MSPELAAAQRDYAEATTPPQGVVGEEGWFSRALRKYDEAKEGARQWARDMGEAVGITLWDPPAAQSARERESKAFAGRPEAESARRYAKGYDIGHGVQNVSGEAGAETGERTADTAIAAAEAETGGRIAGAAIGGVKGLSRGVRGIAAEAKTADQAIEAAQAEARVSRATARAEASETRLLPAGRETTATRDEVARFRGTGRERGLAFDEHLAEAHGGTPQSRINTPLGARVHDVGSVPTGTATEMAIEGKNYLRFRTVGGQAVRGEVLLTPEIKQQLSKDVLWIREGRKAGVHRIVQWEFAGAAPSPELAKALQRWGLPYVH
jgi:hypothetical protein